MTHKECANYLVDKYLDECNKWRKDFSNKGLAIQCALIAVCELINDCHDEHSWEHWFGVKAELIKQEKKTRKENKIMKVIKEFFGVFIVLIFAACSTIPDKAEV